MVTYANSQLESFVLSIDSKIREIARDEYNEYYYNKCSYMYKLFNTKSYDHCEKVDKFISLQKASWGLTFESTNKDDTILKFNKLLSSILDFLLKD